MYIVSESLNSFSFPYQSSVGDYSFEYGIQGQSDYYIATRINPYDTQYLDIVLEGVANGWTAVGFSRNRQMVWGWEFMNLHVHTVNRYALQVYMYYFFFTSARR